MQNINGEGSNEISGGGLLQDEDLIFRFDGPIGMDDMIMGLRKTSLDASRQVTVPVKVI